MESLNGTSRGPHESSSYREFQLMKFNINLVVYVTHYDAIIMAVLHEGNSKWLFKYPSSKFSVTCVVPVLRRELETVELLFIDSGVLLLFLNVHFNNSMFLQKCSS